MSAIGWKVGKATYTYDEAIQIAKETGFFFDYPPAYLNAAKRERVDGHWLSPSAAAGCPRQRALLQTEDYYQDLAGEWSSGVGTAVHHWLQKATPKGTSSYVTEVPLHTKLIVPLRDGTLSPFELRGTADLYDADNERAYDYKTISEFDYWHNGKRERVQKEIPTQSHILQAQLYKYLFEVNGLPVKEYWIWYAKLHADAQRRPVKIELWENDEIEQIACEIAEPLAWFQKTGELPQNKFDSKNYQCRYCPLTAACRRLAKEGK